MNYSTRFFLISVLLSVILLLVAYGMELRWLGGIFAAGFGFLGWFGQHRQKWFWGIHLFLAGILMLVTFGVFLGLRLYFLLPAVLGALTAWDLARFQQRMNKIQDLVHAQKVENRHLVLLGLALGSGGILSGIVLVTRLQIGFGITLVLGVILIISIGQIYRMINNQI
jgi:hypothetical protein